MTLIAERPVEETIERQRPWAEWRCSEDAIVWSPWYFLCWLDEESPRALLPPNEGNSYMQVRVLRPPEPPETSPIYTWPEHESGM